MTKLENSSKNIVVYVLIIYYKKAQTLMPRLFCTVSFVVAYVASTIDNPDLNHGQYKFKDLV